MENPPQHTLNARLFIFQLSLESALFAFVFDYAVALVKEYFNCPSWNPWGEALLAEGKLLLLCKAHLVFLDQFPEELEVPFGTLRVLPERGACFFE